MKKGLYILIILLLITSCKNSESKKEFSQATNGTYNIMVADNIIYDVIIKNPNPEDYWTEECLQGVKQKEFIDIVFNKIYDKEVKAYDIVTDKHLSIREIKEIEKQEGFNRDLIGKIQFEENWYFDAENFCMSKKVNALLFGYEAYDTKGLLYGYSPLFKVKLNN